MAVTSGSSHTQPVPGMRQHFLQYFCGVGDVTLADCDIALKVVQHRHDLHDSASKVVHQWWSGENIASFLQNTQYFVMIIAEFGYNLRQSRYPGRKMLMLDKYRRGIMRAIRRAGLVPQISASAKKGLRRERDAAREGGETHPKRGKNRHGRAVQRHGNKENGETVASKKPIK